MAEKPRRIPIELQEKIMKRWEVFGDASKKCWGTVKEAKKKGEFTKPETAFSRFWKCMGKEAGKEHEVAMSGSSYDMLSSEDIKMCGRDFNIEPHPVCVSVKMEDGKGIEEAELECVEEGHIDDLTGICCASRLASLL